MLKWLKDFFIGNRPPFEQPQRPPDDPSEVDIDELIEPTSLPMDAPPPKVTFMGYGFLFIGTCSYGTREECETFVRRRGGYNLNDVSSVDYVVIGTLVTKSWMYLIEKAIEHRTAHGTPAIISEDALGMPDL